jgi:hypothetical protein
MDTTNPLQQFMDTLNGVLPQVAPIIGAINGNGTVQTTATSVAPGGTHAAPAPLFTVGGVAVSPAQAGMAAGAALLVVVLLVVVARR